MQQQDHDPTSRELRAIGERLDALRFSFESISNTLTTELAVKERADRGTYGAVAAADDSALLALRALHGKPARHSMRRIFRLSCSVINTAVQSLLKLYESVHPDAVLEFTRVRELTARIQA